MLEDRVLIWKLRRGNRDALCRIYEKYRDDMLRIAVGLLNQKSTAEDVVHDVFIAFVSSASGFELTGSLRGYLMSTNLTTFITWQQNTDAGTVKTTMKISG